VNFAFTREEERFRADVREFLEPYRGLDAFYCQGHRWPEVKEFFKAMGERGWLGLAWPKDCGGLDLGIVHEYLLWEEVGYARAARNPLAAGIVAKTMIRHGTEEQKKRWLPSIRTGDTHFSLAYSEPEAGSDLASLRTRAELRGDRYIVNGQKIWQSYAQDMDRFWLLCRTGTQESRGRGLSLLVVDRDTPGLSVEAHPTLDGDQLNGVVFENVEVPVENRVGPQDGAWVLMGQALADERHIQFPPGRARRDLEEMIVWVHAQGLDTDAVVRDRLSTLVVRVQEVEMHALMVLDAMQKGRPGAVEAAASKIVHTVVCQEIARAVLDFGGPEALVQGARPATLWCQSLWETIGGGTTEIMRGIVAKGLGLGGRR
jgi:alkylation response protein AidB-like acyl-CoA dehydrogenase